MARSQHIWVVLRLGRGAPAGAFTVKHELIAWLGKQPDRDDMTIWRCPDGLGQGRETAQIPLAELIPPGT
jgi:hypothetical protein